MRLLTISWAICLALAGYTQKSRPGVIIRFNYELHELYNRDGQESSLLRRTFYNPDNQVFELNKESSYYGFEVGFETSLSYRFANHITISTPFSIRTCKDDYQSIYQLEGSKKLEFVDFTVFSKYINTGIRVIYPITLAENQILHINLNTLMGIEPKLMLSRMWEITNVNTEEANYRSSMDVAANERRWYTDFIAGIGIEFEHNRTFCEVRTLVRSNNREGINGNDAFDLTRTFSYQIGVGFGYRLSRY